MLIWYVGTEVLWAPQSRVEIQWHCACAPILTPHPDTDPANSAATEVSLSLNTQSAGLHRGWGHSHAHVPRAKLCPHPAGGHMTHVVFSLCKVMALKGPVLLQTLRSLESKHTHMQPYTVTHMVTHIHINRYSHTHTVTHTLVLISFGSFQTWFSRSSHERKYFLCTSCKHRKCICHSKCVVMWFIGVNRFSSGRMSVRMRHFCLVIPLPEIDIFLPRVKRVCVYVYEHLHPMR